MISLGRARLILCCAVVFGIGTLAFELPIGELFHQRAELATLGHQLATVNAADAEVTSEIASLHQSTTIAAIAHADYGLVRPGQRAYVVLPSASPTPGAANSLAQQPIPSSDLVPVDPALVGSDTTAGDAPAVSSGGLVSRTVARLEFWRWAF